MEINAEEQIKLKLLKTYVNREVPDIYKTKYLNIINKGVKNGKSANYILKSLHNKEFLIFFNFNTYLREQKKTYNEMVKATLSKEEINAAIARSYLSERTFNVTPNPNNLNPEEVVKQFTNILDAIVKNQEILNGIQTN